ncbi:hypothetical protein JT362_28380 [Actinophytocola sp. S1-96]|uniref:ASCH domain-containing protein n=2 Tax=Actinophytocola gossypii TaxID=2812003 RepID=A0ABT2JGN8_9PSEU|nr:hypothetical protein [Actinophytocola gossypii]
MFRRWRHRQVTAGNVYRTAAGRVVVDAVEVVRPTRIRKRDALAAGYASVAEVLADLRGSEADPVYLLRLHHVDEPDPRDVLAEDADLSTEDVLEITARLARFDAASTHGPWTESTLDIIRRRPAVRAGDLAEELGRETHPFKVDVRKLKNLGLTLSLEVGYRLSPRGEAYLRLR